MIFFDTLEPWDDYHDCSGTVGLSTADVANIRGMVVLMPNKSNKCSR